MCAASSTAKHGRRRTTSMRKYKANWQGWHGAGFGPHMRPIMPPDATIAEGSSVSPDNRGKLPGIRKADGTWTGYPDWQKIKPKAKTHHMIWDTWEAGIGLVGDPLIAIDGDITDKAAAETVQTLAFENLGETCIRYRSNSSKFLLMYHCPGLRKRRVAFKIPGVEQTQALELLGDGQYWNVDSVHPSGERYKWRNGHPALELKAE